MHRPIGSANPRAHQSMPPTVTWIYFLIQRPILSFDPSCYPSPDSTNFHEMHFPAPPPNFPNPLPTAWIVFAAPKDAVRVHKDAVDSTSPSNHSSSSTSSTAKPKKNENENPAGQALYDKLKEKKANSTIIMRTDYDLSFSGVPIFEFSSTLLFPRAAPEIPIRFLSVEHVMGFDKENDEFADVSPREWEKRCREWEEKRPFWNETGNQEVGRDGVRENTRVGGGGKDEDGDEEKEARGLKVIEGTR